MDKVPDFKTGDEIADILITGLLGSGGMGRVLAGFDRRLERRVALKVIHSKRRLDEENRRRFLREARMLSRTNHPKICQIYDLIKGPGGADVLVLEMVDGISLRDRIRDGLKDSEAIDIGMQLLEVLVVVHRQGIVHRDLKPENIIVQEDGEIKVLDFGLAMTVEDGASAHIGAPPPPDPVGTAELPAEDLVSQWNTNLTRRDVLAGTLRYMSPEQARGEPIGSASDLFSTGLILQEMLTGRPAFDETLSFSALLIKVAWADVQAPESLRMPMRGYLERLLSPAPAERPSARDALDQLRFIREGPRRRRKRTAVTVVLCLMTALAAGMGVQWVRATVEAERARKSMVEAQEVSNFLERLFSASDPWNQSVDGKDGPESLSVDTLLERGARRISARFEDQPLARARFMIVLGKIQRRLGRLNEAEGLFEEAVAIRSRNLGSDDPELGRARLELCTVKRDLAKFEEAEDLCLRALEVAVAGEGSGPILQADIEEQRAMMAIDQAEYREAEALFDRVLQLRMLAGDRSALTLQRFGGLQLALGRRDRARDLYQQALALMEEQELENLNRLALLNEVARLDVAEGRLSAAEGRWIEALKLARRFFTPDHPMLATMLTNLANVEDELGRYDAAEPRYLEALDIYRRTVGEDHPDFARVLVNLATLSGHRGKFEDAEELFGQALTSLERIYGSDHPMIAIALNSLAVMKQEQGRFEEAEADYRTCLGIFRAALGPEHPYCSMALNNLGEVNRLQGRHARAEPLYRQALAVSEATNGPDHVGTAEVLRGLALTCAALDQREEAGRLLDRAESILKAAGEPVDAVASARAQAGLDRAASQ